MRSLILSFLTCFSIPLFAPPVIGGAGHSNPVPLPVAPGQLITLFVQGVNTQLTALVQGSGSSLRTLLAGVSVIYRQGRDQLASIVEVRPISTCSGLPTGSIC